jgi:hypothetical protein
MFSVVGFLASRGWLGTVSRNKLLFPLNTASGGALKTEMRAAQFIQNPSCIGSEFVSCRGHSPSAFRRDRCKLFAELPTRTCILLFIR